MNSNTTILKQLKAESWSNRTAWLEMNPEGKFISTYAINSAIEKPKDWFAIAKKCSENPNHKFFGVPPEEIQQRWKSSGASGQSRGNTLDTYISSKLGGMPIVHSQFIDDEKLFKKVQYFDELYDKVLTKMHSYVGSEIWLNSIKLGISAKLDSLFTIHDDSTLLVAEWKNNEKMSLSNRWEKLIGPASHLDNCDHVKFTIQTHIYRYILEEYGYFDRIQTKVFNITSELYKMHNDAFDYDPKFIEELAHWTRASQN